MKKTHYLITFLSISLLFLSGCSDGKSYKRTRIYMGTTAEFNIPARKSDLAKVKDICNAAEAEISRIDELFSIFNNKSEVSKINEDGKKNTVKVSPELLMLVKRAKEYFTLTEGAFDITVGPLTEAWGFGAGEKKHPDGQTLKDILSYIGLDKLEIDEDGLTLIFRDPRIRMDLGGIAKGYAVDKAIRLLRERGVESALVNIGGDLYCLGANRNGKHWSIGIKNPKDRNNVLAVLNVSDKAIATSGSYENFYIYSDKKYAHIIDSHSGCPVLNNLLSVTVIADDCTTADALATAVFVLGEEKGLELIEKLSSIECFLILDDEDESPAVISSGMARYMEKSP